MALIQGQTYRFAVVAFFVFTLFTNVKAQEHVLETASDSARYATALQPNSAQIDSIIRKIQEIPQVLSPDSSRVALTRIEKAGTSSVKIWRPDPTTATWLALAIPGGGQIYNRKYWKLPIVVGGFLGLGYATSWNNNQLRDYTQGYRDLTDSDPATNSYMNFFPPNAQESDFDKQWLTSTMKSRKDYYRRNRDLCIICLVGLYLLCMVDAYVDASLAHFDISDNLSMDMQPVMMTTPVDNRVALGLNWAFNF